MKIPIMLLSLYAEAKQILQIYKPQDTDHKIIAFPDISTYIKIELEEISG